MINMFREMPAKVVNQKSTVFLFWCILQTVVETKTASLLNGENKKGCLVCVLMAAKGN